MIKENPRKELNEEERQDWFVWIGNRRLSIRNVRSKDMYLVLIGKRCPTAEAKWRAEGFEDLNWGNIYELPYKCCKSTKLQSLQYRITNRYIPTRKFLSTRGIVGNALCVKCFEVDSLQHFFFYCKQTYNIIQSVLRQLQTIFRLPSDFIKVETVLFGCQEAPKVANLILLLYKQYIVNCKIGETTEPSMRALLTMIKNFADTEKVTYTRNKQVGQFWNKWGKIINERNELLIYANVHNSSDH